MSFIELTGLRMEGFSEAQIAQIEAIKEDLLHLVATYQQVKPRIDRVIPVLRMMLEVANNKGTQT